MVSRVRLDEISHTSTLLRTVSVAGAHYLLITQKEENIATRLMNYEDDLIMRFWDFHLLSFAA